uniref:Uncharacterized protein n=1 Tax=Lepeophtheirus salmonis TaxID=72036 RepID=A0A0K2UVV2_LEPSM
MVYRHSLECILSFLDPAPSLEIKEAKKIKTESKGNDDTSCQNNNIICIVKSRLLLLQEPSSLVTFMTHSLCSKCLKM